MRSTTRLLLAAALVGLSVAPAFAQGNMGSTSGATAPAQANRPAVTAPSQGRPAATPANPGGSVTQTQPAQRREGQGGTTGGTQGGTTGQAQRATPATPAVPATPAPRVTN